MAQKKSNPYLNNSDKLLETVKMFREDIEKITKADSQIAIARLERKALDEIRLAQVEVEMVGRDLYNAVQSSRSRVNKAPSDL